MRPASAPPYSGLVSTPHDWHTAAIVAAVARGGAGEHAHPIWELALQVGGLNVKLTRAPLVDGGADEGGGGEEPPGGQARGRREGLDEATALAVATVLLFLAVEDAAGLGLEELFELVVLLLENPQGRDDLAGAALRRVPRG